MKTNRGQHFITGHNPRASSPPSLPQSKTPVRPKSLSLCGKAVSGLSLEPRRGPWAGLPLPPWTRPRQMLPKETSWLCLMNCSSLPLPWQRLRSEWYLWQLSKIERWINSSSYFTASRQFLEKWYPHMLNTSFHVVTAFHSKARKK